MIAMMVAMMMTGKMMMAVVMVMTGRAMRVVEAKIRKMTIILVQQLPPVVVQVAVILKLAGS